jgi:hypothetical protein
VSDTAVARRATSLRDEREVPSRQIQQRAVARLRDRRVGPVVLLGLFLLLSLFLDPDGNLGSDVGGKTASLNALVGSGDLDVGYWAAEADPDGSLHPVFAVERFGDRWIATTSLPMILAAWPLAEVGGLRVALLLPALGSVAAAMAAGRLARRLGSGDGAAAFWVTGLGTAATVYALSFWEHSIALGLMAWAVVMLHRAIRPQATEDGRWLHAAASGLLFGAAATMRQEALVYGFAAGLVLTGTLLTASAPTIAERLRRTAVFAPAMAVGALTPLLANDLLERRVLGASARSERASTTASGLGSDAVERIETALLTSIGALGTSDVVSIAFGLTLIVGLVLLVHRSLAGADVRVPLALVVGVYLMIALDFVANGLAFVPALFVTCPVAVIGAVVGIRNAAVRPLAVFALGSLVLVWSVQYTSALQAQWGGRYLLLTAWVLVVIALASAPPRLDAAVRSVALVGVVLALVGVVWSVQRTHQIGESNRALAELDGPVVFWNALDARQAGEAATSGQWLAAADEETRAEAARLLLDSGLERFAYVDVALGGELPEFPGFAPVGERTVPYLGPFEYRVTEFVAD